MNVGHVVLALDTGGLERLVVQVCDKLQQRGIRAVIVSLMRGSLIEEARRRGIRTIALNKSGGFTPSLIVSIARIIKRERLAVVHTHNLSPLTYGSVAAKLMGVPTVNTRHGRAALSAHPLVWKLTDRVIAVSQDARGQLLQHNRIDEWKVTVMPNGVDLNDFHPHGTAYDLRGELGIPTDEAIIGIVARLAPEKDHRTLLSAFRIIVKQGIRARLIIVGDGDLMSALRQHVSELGIGSAVHFLGARSDIPAIVRALDLFVLSSLSEGISLTLLEAMAAARPVVATRVGGNAEVVINGETGLLVAPGNPDALATAMAQTLRDQGLARSFGDRGRERASKVFSLETLVSSHEALYRELAPYA